VIDVCQDVVLVQSDAFAGVQIGVLTALESAEGLRVRVVQEVEDGPLVQVSVPTVVPLDDLQDAVRDSRGSAPGDG